MGRRPRRSPRHVWESSYRLGGNVCFTHTQRQPMAYKKSNGIVAAAAAPFLPSPTAAKLTWLEQIEVNTFGELRQVERYQLKTAGDFTPRAICCCRRVRKVYYPLRNQRRSTLRAVNVEPLPGSSNEKYTPAFGTVQTVMTIGGIDHNAGFLSHCLSYKSIGELKKAEIAYGKAVNVILNILLFFQGISPRSPRFKKTKNA